MPNKSDRLVVDEPQSGLQNVPVGVFCEAVFADQQWRVTAEYRYQIGPKIALVLGRKFSTREKEPLQADSVIASLVNMIAAKTAVPNPVSSSGETFGQILQSTRDETAVLFPGALKNEPPMPELAAAVPLPGQTPASDPIPWTPVHGNPVTTSNPRASDGAGVRALKPIRGLSEESRAAWPQAETVISAAAPIAPIVDVPNALPAQDPTLATGSQPPPSSPLVGAPSGTQATTKTAPHFAAPDDGSAAPPGSNPGASVETTTSAHEPLPAVTPETLPPPGPAAAPTGTGPVRPSRETQRLRPAEVPSESHPTRPTGARMGQQNTVAALSQAAERAEAKPQESNPNNTITFRRVEVAGELAPARSSPSIEQVVPAEISSTPPDAVAVAPIAHVSEPQPAAWQVGSALMTLAKSTDGSEAMIIRLQPAELGRVEIRIARARSGATQVEITAEKTATLLTLQRDQPQLHRTLDEAGIPTAGRSVSFHVAPPTRAPDKETSVHSNGSTGQHDSTDQASGTDGSGSGGKGNNAARKPTGFSNRSRVGDLTTNSAANAVTTSHTYHVGLDITA